jgi:hypothetical protein
VFVDVSVAVQVTDVVPSGRQEPDGGLQLTVTPGQLSWASREKLTTAHTSLTDEVLALRLAGQVIVGASVSLTVTVNAQTEWLFAASVTEQLTVVVPFGKAAPDGGLQIGVPTPGQLSLTTGAG